MRRTAVAYALTNSNSKRESRYTADAIAFHIGGEDGGESPTGASTMIPVPQTEGSSPGASRPASGNFVPRNTPTHLRVR